MGIIEYGQFIVLEFGGTLLDSFGLRVELLDVAGVMTANKLLIGNFQGGSLDAENKVGGLVDLTWKRV